MLDLKVINLYAGPGVGKSTLACGLFNLMKVLGYNVELVSEFAKDLTYAKDFGSLSNQLLILARQDERLRRLSGCVDWVITDSPLPLGLAYMNEEYEEWLPSAIWGAFGRYQNFHVLVNRNPAWAYDPRGRNQKTLLEATKLDNVIDNLFREAVDCDGEEYAMEVSAGDIGAPYKVLETLIESEAL